MTSERLVQNHPVLTIPLVITIDSEDHKDRDCCGVIAFVKERFHNAVEIDILGIFEVYSSLQIWAPPPPNFSGGEITQGE